MSKSSSSRDYEQAVAYADRWKAANRNPRTPHIQPKYRDDPRQFLNFRDWFSSKNYRDSRYNSDGHKKFKKSSQARGMGSELPAVQRRRYGTRLGPSVITGGMAPNFQHQQLQEEAASGGEVLEPELPNSGSLSNLSCLNLQTSSKRKGDSPGGLSSSLRKTVSLSSLAVDACTICLEELRPQTLVTYLPCSHHFHQSCIRTWFHKQPTCPTCRLDVPKALRKLHI